MSKSIKLEKAKLKICNELIKCCDILDKYITRQKFTFEENNELDIFACELLEKSIKEIKDKELAEKDKEIEKLQDFHNWEKEMLGCGFCQLLKDKETETRHQVCEEIKIKGYYCRNGEEEYYKITPSMLWEIEKGE